MRLLNGRYSVRFNRRYGRDAHLFKNRFGAVEQTTEGQLLWVLKYVVRNPVETGMCGDPSEWFWSSYRACTGDEEPPRFLALGRLLSYFADEPQLAMSRYRAHVDTPEPAAGV
jgi:hypothetical protein